MITAEHLVKRFGGHPAVADVSFAVARGEVVGFLGPNGAGKTTTLRLLAGVFPPDAGHVVIDGCDVVKAPLAARRRLGYTPEQPALHPEMTVGGLLEFVAAMRDVHGRRARAHAAAVALDATGLSSMRHVRIETLSRGYRQRVGLAVALVGDPPALLLDEPAAGLDPEQTAEMRRLVRSLGEHHAVLVSSHALADVEVLCDRVIILHRGRMLAEGRPAELAARLRPASRLDVEAMAAPAALEAILTSVPGVERVAITARVNGHSRCRVEASPGVDLRARVADRIHAAGWDLLTLAPVEPTLEEAFLDIVAREELP